MREQDRVGWAHVTRPRIANHLIPNLMKTQGAISEPVSVTVKTLEELIAMDEQRRKELIAEIGVLRIQERVIGATQDASWVSARFTAPRLAELRAVETRITMIRETLTKLVAELCKPAPQPAAVPAPAARWVETNHPSMIALVA